MLSTQVARKFVELFFGRMDARTASYEATGELLSRYFPASYRLLRPGVTAEQRVSGPTGAPVKIAFADREERGALRLFLRALRRLPEELPWEAVDLLQDGAVPTLRSSLRNRVHGGRRRGARAFRGADIVVAASLGQVTAPGVLVKALGVGAVPLARARAGLRGGPARRRPRAALPGRRRRRARRAARAAVRDEELRRAWPGGRRGARGAQLGARGRPGRGDLPGSRRSATTRTRSRRSARGSRKNKLIEVDLHMHTDHSNDCATPVDVLLATAHDVGLGAIAVTDHNEISGALDAREKAAQYGVKVIVGEEVKTADQGEVIGLFIEEKIPRGMTLEETIAEIRRQGGIVYVPHPFDRLHCVPDYEHMLAVVNQIDAIEVFNPRIAIPAFNEEAVRFAAKYRIVGGAGSDSHVAQGLGSVRITMRDFDGPEEFLESLRDADIARSLPRCRYAQVQALKFLQTRPRPPAARRATRRRKVAKAVAGRGGQ